MGRDKDDDVLARAERAYQGFHRTYYVIVPLLSDTQA